MWSRWWIILFHRSTRPRLQVHPTQTKCACSLPSKTTWWAWWNWFIVYKNMLKNYRNRTLTYSPQTSNTTGIHRTNISKHCWTHGECNHNSKNCRYNKRNPGYKEEAMFGNRLNGSTTYYQPVSSWMSEMDDIISRLGLQLTLCKNKLPSHSSIVSSITVAKTDSGATNQYWYNKNAQCLTNLQKLYVHLLAFLMFLHYFQPCKEPYHSPPNFLPT